MKLLKLENIEERVTFCKNGEESYAVIKSSIESGRMFEYSLILTDCNMPFVDGFQATKRMRSLW